MKNLGSKISSEAIRSSYFGPKGYGADLTGGNAAPVNLSLARDDLTPSAKYVIKEAKKRLGQQSAIDGETNPDESDLMRLVQLVEKAEGEELTERERTSVVAVLSASLEHYDILTPLIENPDVNDIIVRAYNDISLQKGRKNIQTDLKFSDQDTYKSFVENLLKRVGKACTTATPVIDAAIDPHIRACVTHESFSPPGSGPMLTLRVARHQNMSLDALASLELAPPIVLEYLAALVADADATILIAGEVGSGKTTLVKALASRIHENEAILTIEDTHEVVLNRRFVRSLLTREANTEGTGRISPAEAIRTGMRMAMNRVILGEMRDSEAAEAFIDVCASGHPGMSTIHSRSARDAIARLELFLARAQGNVSIDTIRKQIANAVSVVVYVDVERSEHTRRIVEVLEVGSAGDGNVQFAPIFRYAPRHGCPEWVRESGISRYLELLKNNGISLPACGETISLDPQNLYRSHVETHFSD